MKGTCILLLLILMSCGERERYDETIRKIILLEEMGEIKFSIPHELDTTYINSYSGRVLFSNKNYYFEQENRPFSEISVEDSLYSLTVSQELLTGHSENQEKADSVLLNQILVMRREENPKGKFSISEVRTIKNRNFVVLVREHDCWGKKCASLMAITFKDNLKIQFSYSCLACNCEGFVETMESSLNSVEITLD